jgi:hypothetical protein
VNAHPGDVRARAGPGLGAAVLFALGDLLPEDHALRPSLTAGGCAGATAASLYDAAFATAHGADARLLAASRALGLGQADILGLLLGLELEHDARVPLAVRAVQGEAFGPWPSLSLLWRLLDRLGRPATSPERALGLGILQCLGERVPGPEQRLAVSPPVLRAFRDRPLPALQAPEDWTRAAGGLAARIAGSRVALVLRDGEEADRRLYAALVADCLELRLEPVVEAEPGLGAACRFGRWLPQESMVTVAGRRSPALGLDGYDGPRVLICNREGGVLLDGWEVVEQALPPLSKDARRRCWTRALPEENPPEAVLAARLGLARIVSVGARAALAEPAPLPRRLRAAMGAEFRPEMEPHAQLVPADAEDRDLAVDEGLRQDLDLLLDRCRFRHAPNNPVPGVRALLSGPSGTGKTLACSWLATRLCLPLFRVDLSSVVSKYIGETEENIARLLDRAEIGDMVLLLDEADSLFASRTETRDSSDRFANNQTNYLLSRIESFAGIAVLTSNGPERIDAAFTRRLDQVIHVPLPAPPQRRAIWASHLPEGHTVTASELNRLAGLIDVSGGHVRNIAQTARVLAGEGGSVSWHDILRAVGIEYRKLGRTVPGGLAR